MTKLGTESLGVFAFPLFVIVIATCSQILRCEAGPCSSPTTGFLLQRDITFSDKPGEVFVCHLFPVPICKGGCAASFEYSVRLQDTSSSATRSCYIDVNHCKATSTTFVNPSTYGCEKYVGSSTVPAPSQNGITVPNVQAASACSCIAHQTSSPSENDCEHKYVVN